FVKTFSCFYHGDFPLKSGQPISGNDNWLFVIVYGLSINTPSLLTLDPRQKKGQQLPAFSNHLIEVTS
ncbi:MAG: hypothetical protein MK081_14180, partial [Flavobacteriales bacterium]|nr:hypothetical protein [Flavobacteriales bacterium]